VTALESIPLFQSLTSDELHALRQIASGRHFKAGQDIFHEGAPGDGVYFVKEGLVEISAGAGERRIFSQLGPGEIFGEMAVIDHQPRSATATATRETEVYFIPREEMLAFIGRSPGFSIALLQLISRRLREFNRQHLREIVEAERLAAVGSFARGIIHDLKNPLSIISLSVDLFASHAPTPEACAQLQSRISRQVLRISDLAGDILAFTEGRRTAELKPGDFHAFVLKETAELQAEVAAKSIQLILENEPPKDLAVSFDARRLGRVLHNLVQNAADFLAENGEIRLRFNVGAKELAVEIEDNGPGIAPEIAGQLFQPFATHGKAKGTGLGLSICKKIIEDHGGKISARSEPGRGAIFTFTLPLAK
jgi:two-component system sensor histidine kinase HydH